MSRLLVIALGGLIGSVARFAVARLFDAWGVDGLPWATLAVNIVGCLAIGVIATVTLRAAHAAWLRPFLITGVLGGFTTVSAFALETGLLLDAGRVGVAAGYVVVTMVAGLLAVRAGALIAGRRSA